MLHVDDPLIKRLCQTAASIKQQNFRQAQSAHGLCRTCKIEEIRWSPDQKSLGVLLDVDVLGAEQEAIILATANGCLQTRCMTEYQSDFVFSPCSKYVLCTEHNAHDCGLLLDIDAATPVLVLTGGSEPLWSPRTERKIFCRSRHSP